MKWSEKTKPVLDNGLDWTGGSGGGASGGGVASLLLDAELLLLFTFEASFILDVDADEVIWPARLPSPTPPDDDVPLLDSLFAAAAPPVDSFFFFCFSFVGVMARGVIIWALLEPSSLIDQIEFISILYFFLFSFFFFLNSNLLRLRMKFVCRRSRVNSLVFGSNMSTHSFDVGCRFPVNCVNFWAEP